MPLLVKGRISDNLGINSTILRVTHVFPVTNGKLQGDFVSGEALAIVQVGIGVTWYYVPSFRYGYINWYSMLSAVHRCRKIRQIKARVVRSKSCSLTRSSATALLLGSRVGVSCVC